MATSWNMSKRTRRTGSSLYVSPDFKLGAPLIHPERQLHGAAQGLKYLHDANLTHGDLKGVRDSTRSNAFAIVSYSAAGKHSHDKSHAPSGMPCGFRVHDNGA